MHFTLIGRKRRFGVLRLMSGRHNLFPVAVELNSYHFHIDEPIQ